MKNNITFMIALGLGLVSWKANALYANLVDIKNGGIEYPDNAIDISGACLSQQAHTLLQQGLGPVALRVDRNGKNCEVQLTPTNGANRILFKAKNCDIVRGNASGSQTLVGDQILVGRLSIMDSYPASGPNLCNGSIGTDR